MHDRPPAENNPPTAWIDRFLAAASVLAGAAALAAVFGTGGDGYQRYTDTVADLVVNLNGTPVREHCTTCHPAGAPAPAGGRAHPDVGNHDTDDLGCTGCHLGEGMALDTRISHGRIGDRSRAILSGPDVQAACYRCHRLGPLAGAERAWNGYRLFRDMACDACHHVATVGRGARYGPDLSHVGTYLGLEQLVTAVADPRRGAGAFGMPRFPLSDAEVRDLAYFLKSRVENPAHSTPMQQRAAERRTSSRGRDADGAALAGAEGFRVLGCRACHRLGDDGNRIGPDLTHIGRQRDADYLLGFLDSPGRRLPGARMPRIPMAAPTRQALVAFLAASAQGFADTASPKRVYMALCQGCHAADGSGRGPIQPNLAQFPRAFRDNGGFFRALEDTRLVQSVENGVAGTSMPPFGRILTNAQIEATMDLLFRAFVRQPRRDKTRLRPLPPMPAAPVPQTRVAQDYEDRCQGCHGRAGNGKGPRSARFLPRPRNLTNRPYFEAIGEVRVARAVFDGVPGTAMTGFRDDLPPERVWGLVGRVRRFWEDPGD